MHFSGFQWRTLAPEEKSKFEKLAAEDKERYNKECAVSIAYGSVALVSSCLSPGLREVLSALVWLLYPLLPISHLISLQL